MLVSVITFHSHKLLIFLDTKHDTVYLITSTLVPPSIIKTDKVLSPQLSSLRLLVQFDHFPKEYSGS